MGILATYLPSTRCVARVEAAVGTLHTCTPVNSWDALEQLCNESPVDIAVVDLYADGTANFEALRRLRTYYTGVTLIAYVAFAAERARDMFDLGRSGVDGLLLADTDDRPRTIRNVVERAEARGAAPELRRLLNDHSPLVRDAVLISVTRAHERLTAVRLAQILAVSRRSLSSELLRAGFPPPAKLVTWGRLIVAGQMLADRQRSADAVARALDFPSGSAFRNTCQRYLNFTPSEVRTTGGANAVLLRFMETAGLNKEP